MDEQDYTRILEAEPDNDVVRLAYWNWIEESDDHRAPYVRLMRERSRLLQELKEVDCQLENYHWPRIGEAWIEMAFPLRVVSPTVGRCYLRPSPDAAPFVSVGSVVTPETTVCLIESMKLYNDIKAGVHGIVSHVVVANEAPVEYNQILFRVSRPSFDFW